MFKKTHVSDVFSCFLVGVIFGTIFSVWREIDFFYSAYWVIFSLLTLFFGLFRPTRAIFVIVFVGGAVLGAFRVSGEIYGKSVFRDLVGKTIQISGEIKKDPDFEGKNGKVALDSLEIDGQNIHGVIYLSGQLEHKIRRGDRLTIQGVVSSGFGAYSASFRNPKIEKIERAENPSFLLIFRDKFAEATKKAILREASEESEDELEEKQGVFALVDDSGEREANLGLAYLTGLRTGLDSELSEILSLVGLTHIVVASGTHLGILVGFFRKVFGRFSRFSGLYFGLLFILLFGEMIGWTPSITRAGIVAILGIFGWFLGRSFDSWRIIIIAMAATLLINPMNLVDLGWLLSFGSFIGIMILSPTIIRFFYGEKRGGRFIFRRKPGAITEIILATVSATLMCGPILLYFYGSLSIISVLANLLILPTIPFAMGLVFLSGISGLIGGALSGVFVTLSRGVGVITKLLLDYHLVVMQYFSEKKMFLINIPKENPKVFLVYIPILLPFIIEWIIRGRKIQKQRKEISKKPWKSIKLTRIEEKHQKTETESVKA